MAMLNWQGWAANFIGWGPEGEAVVIPPPSLKPAGGLFRNKRKKVWIEPQDDGPVIEIDTVAEVPKAVKAIKRQAKAIAEKAVDQRKPIPELPEWVVHGDKEIAAEMERRIDKIRTDFADIYHALVLRQRQEDDDEDVLLLIL